MAGSTQTARQPRTGHTSRQQSPIGGRLSVTAGSALAAVSIAASVVSGLSVIFADGLVTALINERMALGLGWTAPLLPLWLAATGGLYFWRRAFPDRSLPWLRVGGAMALSLGMIAGAHLLPVGDADLVARAEQGSGGGALGMALSEFLWLTMGPGGTLALVTLSLGAGLLALLRWSPLTLVAQRPPRSGLPGPESRGQTRAPGPGTLNSGLGPRHLGWPRLPPGLLARFRKPAPILVPAQPATSAADDSSRGEAWRLPPLTILQLAQPRNVAALDLRQRARIIEETLLHFNIEAKVVEINPGPAVTQFGLEPAPGVAVNRILARSSDLALRLGASPVRLEAPVPGKRVVGIEVPNGPPALVSLRELLQSEEFRQVLSGLGLPLGKDVSGKPVVGDLAKMPHLLIAGATGSGKSVCINAIISSLLMQATPEELQLLLIDPKMVELTSYSGVPHLRMPVVTDMERVVGALRWAVQEMERRYAMLSARGVRNLQAFNELAERELGQRVPYLVVVVDELADMMMTASDEVERTLCRLAQLGRAAGLHLVVATQRPSVDVLTGLIKANFVSRIAFSVSSQIDSRVILDMAGAEKLLGRGDMLYLSFDSAKPIRLQGPFVSDEEIHSLVTVWQGQGPPLYTESEVESLKSIGTTQDDDELLERAAKLAGEYRRLSVSLLQRRLGIGYPRAARLLDLLEERGLLPGDRDGPSADDARGSRPEV